MRIYLFILVLFAITRLPAGGQVPAKNSFSWGHITFVNLSVGEKYPFESSEIELLRVKNHFNLIRIDHDTTWMKVNRRSPAVSFGNVRVYIADNRNVKALFAGDKGHQLLTGDVLLALAPGKSPLLDPSLFVFPVDFTDGYIWRGNEETYMFSYLSRGSGKNIPEENKGVGLDMFNSRAAQTNLIVSVENGTVEWIETDKCGLPRAAVCIGSESYPGIYYIYENLHDKYVFVKKNQKIVKGEGIGYTWGEGTREFIRLTVIRSDSVPTFENRYTGMINFYPPLLELYYGKNVFFPRVFSKGQIDFGKPGSPAGTARNTAAYEDYEGTGWVFGNWNTADKTEWVSNRTGCNARLRKVLFEGEPASCTNPVDYYTYEINVRDGLYRIRASVGDCCLPSWQKVEFEGITAGAYSLSPGEYTWTPEKIVRVKDGRLTMRIYLPDNSRVAGMSEIVFQQAD